MERNHTNPATPGKWNPQPPCRETRVYSKSFYFQILASAGAVSQQEIVAGKNEGIAKLGKKNTVDSKSKTESYILFLTNKTIQGFLTQKQLHAMN